MDKPAIEQWAEDEYRDGVSPEAAARQLCRTLGASCAYPTLRRMLEDMLANANRASLEAALRKIADMQSDDEPVAYSWGLEFFKRAHAIAREALDK